MAYVRTGIAVLLLMVGSAVGENYGHLRRSRNWWQEFFLRHYATNEFRLANADDISCIVVLIHEIGPRGSWVVFRDGHCISTNMPTALDTEDGRQRVLISTKAVDFLCQAPNETNRHAIAGLATYCTSNGVVSRFRSLAARTLEAVPDAEKGFVVRIYGDRIKREEEEAEQTVGGDGRPAPQP